jgi:hypothetical protein
VVAATTFIFSLMGSLGVHLGLQRLPPLKMKPIMLRFGGLALWLIALPFAIKEWGVELGICWWLLLVTLSMAAICVVDYFTKSTMRPGAARDVTNIQRDASLAERKPKLLAALPWLGMSVAAFCGALSACMVLVIVLPGSSKDVIAFAGLLVPLAIGILVFVMAAAVDVRTAAIYILVPTLPSLMIILVEVLL